MCPAAVNGRPIGVEPTAPVLVKVVRGEIVEAQHRGDVAIVGSGGVVRGSLGAADRIVSLRSAIKPFTAAAVLMAIEAAGGGMESDAIALSSASHAGTEEHVAVAETMVTRHRLDTALLVHGRPTPLRSGSSGSVLQHMCSGQHLSLLMLAQALGVDGRGYEDYEHPVQQRLRTVVGEILGTDLGAAPWGVDGCAIPTYAVPLHVAAEGARRWANPDLSDLSPALTAALARVRDAAVAHPRLISGAGFLDTDLIRGGEGVVVAKQGAEGLCLVGAPGIGIAVHTDDGDAAARAGRVATVATLRAAGVDVANSTALDAHRTVRIAGPRPSSTLARAEATTAFDALTLI
jgi:L-asparaginase II